MYSLIIVDYCSIEKTIKYIEHIYDNSVNPYLMNVIIIDNSPEKQKDEISLKGYVEIDKKNVKGKECFFFKKDEFDICYCYSGENLGFARGNNLGTIIADELFNDDYYIISNNDLKLNEKIDFNVFKSIFESDSQIAVIGPRIIGLDGKIQSPHKRISAFKRLILYYWLSRWPFYINLDYDYTGNNKECFRVMGCFMLIKAEPFRRVERFDSNTFLFFEESILSERLIKKGFKTYFYDDFSVVHEHSATIRKMNSVIQSERLAFDSGCYYYKKYRNVSPIILFLAKANFALFVLSLRTKNMIKRIVGK